MCKVYTEKVIILLNVLNFLMFINIYTYIYLHILKTSKIVGKTERFHLFSFIFSFMQMLCYKMGKKMGGSG